MAAAVSGPARVDLVDGLAGHDEVLGQAPPIATSPLNAPGPRRAEGAGSNYRERRRAQQYIGSGHVEKANDLQVARRQKNRGMQWSLETSEGLAALRTLMLNGGWERYWAEREVLPWAEAVAA